MHKQVLVLIISVTVSCCAGASKVVAAAAASAANTATAIATYHILRSMGAQPQIQATPYGMVTTSEGKQHQPYQQNADYNSQNQQDQKIQFMQQR